MLRCGKHSGRPFADVAAADPSYCAWVLRERANGTRLSRDLKAFANYVQDVHGGVLVVGKHSGRFFDEVLRDDADYAEWAASLENPSKLMVDFQDYVKKQRKRPRVEGSDICSVCLDRTIDTAFVPCGHMTACLSCARRLHADGTSCPICREGIGDVLQTYLAGAGQS